MEKKKPELIVIGVGNDPYLIAKTIEALSIEHPNVEVVTIDEVRERSIVPTFELKAPLVLPQITLKDNFFSNGKSARNKRREAERKNKKKRK
jgi:DUF917 family protein